MKALVSILPGLLLLRGCTVGKPVALVVSISLSPFTQTAIVQGQQGAALGFPDKRDWESL
jgi:hypothetical protein